MKKSNKERLLLIGFCKITMEHILGLIPVSEKKLYSKINFDDWNKGPLEGIRMAANDMVEWGSYLSKDQIDELDNKLEESGFPTLTAMKHRNYQQVLKILSRGVINSDKEYYLLNSYLTDVDCKELSTEEISNAEQIIAVYEPSKK
jgi:hypothetical protein